jgi:hypothetical protein
LGIFKLIRYADVPARNKNTGAQKCVIHRVKKRIGVVVFKSRGHMELFHLQKNHAHDPKP